MKKKPTNQSTDAAKSAQPSTKEELPVEKRELPVELWFFEDTAWTRQFLIDLRWELPKIKTFQETDEDSWQNEGIDLLEAGKFKEAELPFKKFILAQPQLFDGFEGLARAWSGQGQHIDADRLMDAALCRGLRLLEEETLDLPVYEGTLKIRKTLRAKGGLASGDGSDYFEMLVDPLMLDLRKIRDSVPKGSIAAMLNRWEIYHVKLGQYIQARLLMIDREIDFERWRGDQRNYRDFRLPPPDSSILFALFLLAHKREKRAFPILREFLEQGEEAVRHDLGHDSLYEDLPKIIASLWDGSPTSLETMIFAETLACPLRMGALTASLMLVLHERLERPWLIEVLRKLAGVLHPKIGELGSEFAWTIAHLKATELTAELKSAFEKGHIEELIAPQEEIDEVFAADAEATKTDLLKRERFSWIDDPVALLATWGQFDGRFKQEPSSPMDKLRASVFDSYRSEMEEKEEFQGRRLEPHEIKAPETGRNDPCPCGSGQKFKKCCMNK